MQHDKKGYGYVYQNVMRNKSITPEAKAIYAYLASFAGNNEKCYPGIELMIVELGISKTRFYKHMQVLLDKGIILKQQEKQGNKFSKNTYTINSFPRFNDAQNEYTKNEDTQSIYTQNLTNNSNSSNSNSFKSNSNEHTPRPQKHKYGEYQHVLITDKEKECLISEYGQDMFDKCITKLDEYIEMKGYKAKNHNLCIRKWVIKAVNEEESKQGQKGCDYNKGNNGSRREVKTVRDYEIPKPIEDVFA